MTSRVTRSTITDTLGRQTVSEYDSHNNLVRQTLGITTTFPLGFTNFYTYTNDHRLEAYSGPDGVVTRTAYDAQGQVISRTVGSDTPLAQTSTYGYDRYGRVVTTTVGFDTPLERMDVTNYNHDDTIAETIQNYQDGVFTPSAPDQDIVTTYGYDGLGRPTWVRDVLGRYDVTHYDAAGRVDWQASNFVQGGWSGGALPSSPPAYSASAPDQQCGHLLWHRWPGSHGLCHRDRHPDRHLRPDHAAVQRCHQPHDLHRVRYAEPAGHRHVELPARAECQRRPQCAADHALRPGRQCDLASATRWGAGPRPTMMR